MQLHRFLIATVVLLTLISCGRKKKEITPADIWASKAKQVRQDKVTPPALDEKGKLIESDQVVHGLRLPRGLELKFKKDREQTFYSTLDVKMLEIYFAKRLLSTKPEKHGLGLVFRRAVVRGTPESNPLLDVSILPLAQGGIKARVSIVELPGAPTKQPNEAEMKAYMRKAFKRLD